MKLAEIQALSESIKEKGQVEVSSSSLMDISQVLIQFLRDTHPDLTVVRKYVSHNYAENNYKDEKNYVAYSISYWISNDDKPLFVNSEVIARYLDCLAYLMEQNNHPGYPDHMESVPQKVRVAFQDAGAPLN